MFTRILALLLAVVTIAGLVPACTSGGSGSTGNGITIQETEMKFIPNSITVKAGQKVTITLKNTGVVTHDFTIDDVDGQKVSKPVEPGQSATVSFTAPSAPGTLDFYCSQPGHKQAGMTGTITVQ